MPWISEIRQAGRRLARRPLFALTCVVILALGIGANTAVFSLLDAVVLRPLPVPDPERLTHLRERDPDGSLSLIGYETYLDLAERSRTLARLAVSSQRQPTITNPDGARTLDALAVTHTWLPTLGVEPALGRNFTSAEDRPGAPRVLLLGHALWKSQFASDAAIVGRNIELNDTPYEVLGVLPPELDRLLGPGAGRRLDLIVPLRYARGLPYACRDCRHLNALARIRPDATLEGARAELDASVAALRSAYPDKYPSGLGALVPLGDELIGRSRELLAAVFAGVVLVLLLAVGNVAALLVVRAVERSRELAIRRSLGADRRRLLAAAFGESALLSLAGALVGLLIARPTLTALVALSPSYLPRLDAVGLSLPVLGFTLASALLVALASGIAPAMVHLRTPARAALAAGGNAGLSRRSRRGLSLLVVAELTLALVVVFAAALLGRSLERLMAEDTGFRPEGVVKADVQTNGSRYDEDAQVHAFFDRALESVRALPGIVAAGWTSQLPLGGNRDSYSIRLEDKPEMRLEEEPAGDRYAVTPGYFAALGIRLVAGRLLTDADRAGSEPVVLINRRLAERIWPDQGALGKRIQVGGPDAPWRTVVGAVEEVLHYGLDRPSVAQFYVPEAQWPWADSGRVLVVRSSLPPERLARPIAEAIRAVDPKCPVEHFATMANVIEQSTGGRRFATTLWGAFALLSLLLAATGTYGLLARQVAMRRRDLATRSALGARPSRLAAELGGEAARWLVTAAVLALPILWVVGRLLAAQLWKLPPSDPETFGLAVGVVGAMALLAGLSPARRAARVDPATVLREE